MYFTAQYHASLPGDGLISDMVQRIPIALDTGIDMTPLDKWYVETLMRSVKDISTEEIKSPWAKADPPGKEKQKALERRTGEGRKLGTCKEPKWRTEICASNVLRKAIKGSLGGCYFTTASPSSPYHS